MKYGSVSWSFHWVKINYEFVETLYCLSWVELLINFNYFSSFFQMMWMLLGTIVTTAALNQIWIAVTEILQLLPKRLSSLTYSFKKRSFIKSYQSSLLAAVFKELKKDFLCTPDRENLGHIRWLVCWYQLRSTSKEIWNIQVPINISHSGNGEIFRFKNRRKVRSFWMTTIYGIVFG